VTGTREYPGPLDSAVCDQIVMESHGNPLALLELPRTVSRIDARPAEIIAHGWAAGLERTGQAAGTGSRRACQWAVLTAGDPA